MTIRNQTSGTSTSRTQTEVSYGGIRTIETDEQRTINTGALRTINIPDTIWDKITTPSTSWTIA